MLSKAMKELRDVPTGSTWCPRNGPCWNNRPRRSTLCAVTGGLQKSGLAK